MSEFITIEEAKQTLLIPAVYHEYFHNTCKYCDGPVHISKNLTILKCSNPNCYRRLAKQLTLMLHDLAVKDWGTETLTAYLCAEKINSFTEFLRFPPLGLQHIIADIQERQLSFAQLVQLMHIPMLGVTSRKLFNNCDSFADFKQKMNSMEVPRLYLEHFTGGTVSAEQLLQVLTDYDSELSAITELITPVASVKKSIPIALTGYITQIATEDGRRLTKDQFIQALNKIARPCNFEFVKSSAYESVSFIIADQPSNSAKYNIGKRRGILKTSAELYRAIKQIADEQSETKETTDE